MLNILKNNIQIWDEKTDSNFSPKRPSKVLIDRLREASHIVLGGQIFS